MSNLRTLGRCTHNAHLHLQKRMDWCQLCGAIRLWFGEKKTRWLFPPVAKRIALDRLHKDKAK